MPGAGARSTVWVMQATGLHLPRGLKSRPASHPYSRRTQLRWFGAALGVGFAVPYLGSSVLDLQHDVYLAVYFAAVGALLAAYAIGTGLDVREAATRHWKLGLAVGVVFGFALVRNVLADLAPAPRVLRDIACARPDDHGRLPPRL